MATINAKQDRQMPGTFPGQTRSGTTASMTGTTSTQVIAAPGAGLRLYVTSVTVVNSHATQSTLVSLQDGSGGTALWHGAARADYGGTVITFPTPIRLSVNTALFCVNLTTGAATRVSATAYTAQ